MKIALITANSGSFEKPFAYVPQSVEHDVFVFNDTNFPRRDKALSARLQARIPKMFGWQMVPGYDIYIWIDSSCTLQNPDSIKWLIEKLGDANAAFFKHPNRGSIQEEADYLKQRLAKGCEYITPRYENELIDECLSEIKQDKLFADYRLFASTVFIYRNNRRVHEFMREWWYGTSRYHIIDQLWLPYAISKAYLQPNIIQENYGRCDYIKYTRNL